MIHLRGEQREAGAGKGTQEGVSGDGGVGEHEVHIFLQ